MGTKTISVTDEAYGILRSRKEDRESFSEAIVKLAGKKKLVSFAGVLSKKSADAIEREMKETRNLHRRSHQSRIQNDFR